MGYTLGLYGDSGKENGNYYNIITYTLGLYRDPGKENANYGDYIGGMENKMETTIIQ